MSKALIVWGPISALANGLGIAIAGGAGSASDEARAAYQATEAATFSGLSFRIASGGSGTNNLRFQKNVTNANQIATVVGPGLAEDTTNTDVLVATDTFGGAYTDDGTDSAVIFSRCNVEFASGHGSFHASSDLTNTPVFDVPGARYAAFSGLLSFDGAASADTQQWRNRGYDLCTALQVRVITNARVNDSVLSLNVNGTDVGTPITVGAGLTGLFVVTGIDQALASGDLICLSVTLGAGVEDFRPNIFGGTFKSSTLKSDIWAHSHTGIARTASATPNYIAPGGHLNFALASTEANSRLKIGFPCRIANLRSYVPTNTYTGSSTVKVFVNGSAAVTLTITAAGTGWFENTTDGINVGASDEVSLEFLGGTSGSATFYSAGFTMEPVSITPVSGEFDQEASNAGLTNNIASIGAEFGHEDQSPSLTQEHVLSTDSGEFDHEVQSGGLTQEHVVSPESSEYEIEAQSSSLTFNVIAQESEFDHEFESAALSNNLGADHSEYGHEVLSAALTQNYDLAPDTAEYDFESSSASIAIPYDISIDSAEFDHESRSVSLVTQSSPSVESSEYGFDLESVALSVPVVITGKALIVYGPEAITVNNEWFALFGAGNAITGESRSQLLVTEGVTFSGMAWRGLGASGSNTLRFRNNSVNGLQVASRVGPGLAEDINNSDVAVVNDLVNYAWTDTGTDAEPLMFARINVEFDSGHGNFHLAAAPSPALDLNFSATRFFSLSGALTPAQSYSTVTNAQFRNRAYNTVAAIQAHVVANDKVTDTTFRLNVNGVAVGTTLTVGAGLTGKFSITGLGHTIESGDLICLQWTGSGSEEFVLTVLGATLKSSSGKSETWASKRNNTRSASGTPTYYNIGGVLDPVSTEANHRIRIGFAANITGLRLYAETNTYTGSATAKVLINGSAALTLTIPAATAGWHENVIDEITVDEDDQASLEVSGGTSGSLLFHSCGFTFGQFGTAVIAQASEHSFEAQSVELSQGTASTSSEFDHEIKSASLVQVNAVEVGSMELGFETDEVLDESFVQCDWVQHDWVQGCLPRLDVRSSEYGAEVRSAALVIQSVLQVDSSEYGWECGSVDISQLSTATLDDSEYGWESESVFLRRFVHGQAPTHRRRYVIE